MSDSDLPDRTPPPPSPGPIPEPAEQPAPQPAPYGAAVAAPMKEPVTATTGKADLTKRFVAFLIDAVIASVLTSVIPVVGGILGAAYMLLRDGFDFDFMKLRSLGKRVMGLRPVLVGGGAMNMQVSIRRNWPFALGVLTVIPLLGLLFVAIVAPILGLIEGVLVLTDDQGRRFGDKLAETKVIESAT